MMPSGELGDLRDQQLGVLPEKLSLVLAELQRVDVLAERLGLLPRHGSSSRLMLLGLSQRMDVCGEQVLGRSSWRRRGPGGDRIRHRREGRATVISAAATEAFQPSTFLDRSRQP
jgi:hypothetical protein